MNRILPKTGKVKMRRLLHKYHVSLKGYWDRDRKNSKLGLRSYGTPEPLSQVSRLRAHPSIGSIFCLLWFWNLELTQGSIEFLWNWLEVVLVFVYDCRSQRSGDYSNAYALSSTRVAAFTAPWSALCLKKITLSFWSWWSCMTRAWVCFIGAILLVSQTFCHLGFIFIWASRGLPDQFCFSFWLFLTCLCEFVRFPSWCCVIWLQFFYALAWYSQSCNKIACR